MYVMSLKKIKMQTSVIRAVLIVFICSFTSLKTEEGNYKDIIYTMGNASFQPRIVEREGEGKIRKSM